MEDVVGANAVKEVNSAADRIYYELDGEGDADSSTTPSHNVDHRDRKYYLLVSLLHVICVCARMCVWITELIIKIFNSENC